MKKAKIQLTPLKCFAIDYCVDISKLNAKECRDLGIYISKTNSTSGHHETVTETEPGAKSPEIEVVTIGSETNIKKKRKTRTGYQRMPDISGAKNGTSRETVDLTQDDTRFQPRCVRSEEELILKTLLTQPRKVPGILKRSKVKPVEPPPPPPPPPPPVSPEPVTYTNLNYVVDSNQAELHVLQLVTSPTLPEGAISYGMINDQHLILREVVQSVVDPDYSNGSGIIIGSNFSDCNLAETTLNPVDDNVSRKLPRENVTYNDDDEVLTLPNERVFNDSDTLPPLRIVPRDTAHIVGGKTFEPLARSVDNDPTVLPSANVLEDSVSVAAGNPSNVTREIRPVHRPITLARLSRSKKMPKFRPIYPVDTRVEPLGLGSLFPVNDPGSVVKWSTSVLRSRQPPKVTTGDAGTSSVGTSSVGTSSVCTSSAGTSSAGTLSAGTSSVGTSSAGTSSGNTSGTGTSSVGTSSAGTSSAGTLSAGTCIAKQPKHGKSRTMSPDSSHFVSVVRNVGDVAPATTPLARKRENLALQVHHRTVRELETLRVARRVTLPLREVHLFDVGCQTDVLALVEPGKMLEINVKEREAVGKSILRTDLEEGVSEEPAERVDSVEVIHHYDTFGGGGGNNKVPPPTTINCFTATMTKHSTTYHSFEVPPSGGEKTVKKKTSLLSRLFGKELGVSTGGETRKESGVTTGGEARKELSTGGEARKVSTGGEARKTADVTGDVSVLIRDLEAEPLDVGGPDPPMDIDPPMDVDPPAYDQMDYDDESDPDDPLPLSRIPRNINNLRTDVTTTDQLNVNARPLRNINLSNLDHDTKIQAYLDWVNCVKKDPDTGNLPIHQAVLDDDPVVLERQCFLLTARKMSLDLKNFSRKTPLHLAVSFGRVKAIATLRTFGARIEVTDLRGNNSIHLACEADSTDSLRALLATISSEDEASTLPINAFNDNGFTPLHICSVHNNAEHGHLLLDNNADPNLQDLHSGRTPLFVAIEQDRLAIAQTLMKAGAKPNVAAFSGHTAGTLLSEEPSDRRPVLRKMFEKSVHKEMVANQATRGHVPTQKGTNSIVAGVMRPLPPDPSSAPVATKRAKESPPVHIVIRQGSVPVEKTQTPLPAATKGASNAPVHVVIRQSPVPVETTQPPLPAATKGASKAPVHVVIRQTPAEPAATNVTTCSPSAPAALKRATTSPVPVGEVPPAKRPPVPVGTPSGVTVVSPNESSIATLAAKQGYKVVNVQFVRKTGNNTSMSTPSIALLRNDRPTPAPNNTSMSTPSIALLRNDRPTPAPNNTSMSTPSIALLRNDRPTPAPNNTSMSTPSITLLRNDRPTPAPAPDSAPSLVNLQFVRKAGNNTSASAPNIALLCNDKAAPVPAPHPAPVLTTRSQRAKYVMVQKEGDGPKTLLFKRKAP